MLTAEPIVATCEVAGCAKPTRSGAAKWCNTHYFRWYRHGHPEALHDQRYIPKVCAVDDCGRLTKGGGRGWCKEHYDRWIRHGDPAVIIDRSSKGWLHADGYRMLHIAGHPLASASGAVMEHRVILYDKIGPGSHPCHWCGRIVSWAKSWPRDADALVTDHLDGDRLHNDPENIVASCQPCNVSRGSRMRGAA